MESYFYWIVASFGLIYLCKVPVALAMFKEKGGYDNHHPREQQAKLTGWGKRALGAHMNSFESFPIFAIGILVAHETGAPASIIHLLGGVHIVSRILYLGFYLMNFAFLRSTVWTIGIVASALLYFSKFLG
jgi:uncharacterized MAPEG superfamily protein